MTFGTAVQGGSRGALLEFACPGKIERCVVVPASGPTKMSVTAIPPDLATFSVPGRAPLLHWMIFTGLCAFAAILLWQYGLIRLMIASDRTYISTIICVLYVASSLHCLWRTLAIAREADASRETALVLDKTAMLSAPGEATAWRDALPPGLVSDHIRNLVVKAETRRSGRVDQTLLLRSLADRLRGSNGFGAFASDTLMKLGLLGTIIGFIVMLAPIAGLDATDRAMMKSSMGVMSDGMAIAMYTTLAGLVGSILLRIQYYMLDAATARVFSQAVTLTETRVVPALERVHER
jgi:MotA/TolQ/ExbB proton channel family